MENLTTRTTLTLPIQLLEATDLMVKSGKVKSRNEFVAQALRKELAAQRRSEIDAAFAEMASDSEYQAEALQVDREFTAASWEALQLVEEPSQ